MTAVATATPDELARCIGLAEKDTPYSKGTIALDVQGRMWKAMQDDPGTDTELGEPVWRRVATGPINVETISKDMLAALEGKREANNKMLAGVMGTAIGELRKEVKERLALLDKRIEALANNQKTLADSYKGAHLRNASYERGELVTRTGAVYLALEDTTEAPGESSHWKMIAKGGA